MTTAHDKHNHPIKVGDIIEVVYGGEHHTLTVASLSESQGHHYVHGSVNVQVPATACSRRKDENPKDAPRDDSKVHVREDSGEKKAHLAATEHTDKIPAKDREEAKPEQKPNHPKK